MKRIIILLLLFSIPILAQDIKDIRLGQAKGLFMSVGVGPRIPLGDAGDKENLGVGFDVNFSYADNAIVPFFIYGGIGYEHYPGRQDFYKVSDYSSYSTNAIMLTPGVRYYFKPLVEDIVLLMPVVELGATVAFFEKYHQFKIDRNKQDFVEDQFSAGFHVGAGFSMFLLDVMLRYNYLPSNQFISFDLRARIPIFVTI